MFRKGDRVLVVLNPEYPGDRNGKHHGAWGTILEDHSHPRVRLDSGEVIPCMHPGSLRSADAPPPQMPVAEPEPQAVEYTDQLGFSW